NRSLPHDARPPLGAATSNVSGPDDTMPRSAMDDLLIRGGHVVDGGGGPGRDADVAVQAGRIAAVEPRSARPARRVIDARGQVVAPGLIDIHTHSDFTLPLNPRAESKIRQGVTLEVVGNCGFSVAPVLPGRAALLREYLASSAPWLSFQDTTFADYVAAFPPTSVNVVLQVGHNTLRLMTAGLDNRPLTPGEMTTMEGLLDEALAAGAWGLSSGLFTAPGHFADAAEIHALARVLRRRGAAYSTHVRDEADHGFEAVREAIAVAEATGVHVQIAHLKLSGVDNWGGAVRLLEEIASARRRGLPVDCDAYPYDTATNPLRNLLPRWVMEGGIPAMLERLRSREVRTRLRDEIARQGLTNFGRIPSWDAVRVAISPHLPENAGRTLGDIARRRRVDPLDAVADYVVADRGETRILITSMADADVHEITRAPWVTVGSDGNALAISGVTGQGKPHPRYYGTHARVLGPCVRDLRLLTLEQAIAKMTGAAARALGLPDRGLVRAGAWADVTVFDPARIADRATYEDPHRYAVGVSTVVVNGQVVVDGGDHTGALPGRVLRRGT
ncbi:MAG TPA: D-aminoacylase, partial [Methylomirabilota bacterium]